MKGNKKPKNKRRLYINKKYIHIYKKERAIIIEPLLHVDMSAQGSRGPRALAIITWLLSHCQSFTNNFSISKTAWVRSSNSWGGPPLYPFSFALRAAVKPTAASFSCLHILLLLSIWERQIVSSYLSSPLFLLFDQHHYTRQNIPSISVVQRPSISHLANRTTTRIKYFKKKEKGRKRFDFSVGVVS